MPGYNDRITAFSHQPPAIKSDFKMWQRERITITLSDFHAPDTRLDDPYLSERGGVLAAVNQTASWWARFLQRHKYFARRAAVFEIGTVAAGVFTAYTTHNLFLSLIHI